MDDLIAWLRGVLDEDEQVAQAAESEYASPWAEFWGMLITQRPSLSNYSYQKIAGLGTVLSEYVARHDPAAVLADIEAKRAILNEHRPVHERDSRGEIDPTSDLVCLTCGYWGVDEDAGGNRVPDNAPVDWPCPTLRLLASAYRDRAGYREEWRPE